MKLKLLIFLAVVSGCAKKTTAVDENCIRYADAYVSSIEKTTATTLNVSFPVNGGCGQFNKFVETTSGNTTTIKVNAVYKGCMCTMDIPTRTTTYKLKETKPGTYYLKFVSGEGQYITDTLIIK
jgi:hypothetical protein